MKGTTRPPFFERSNSESGAQGKAASDHIADRLREEIISGAIISGTPLVETDISAGYGASRNTVREAMRQLRSEGLIIYIRHRGATVRTLTPADVRDIYRVRRALELSAIEQSAFARDELLADVLNAVQSEEQAMAAHRWRGRNLESPIPSEPDRPAGERAAGRVLQNHRCEGPQVGDLNLWNRHNPRERMWAARTRQLQSAHVSTFDRLWSTLPYLRPMVTITGDSLADYGTDDDGGRVHDLLGSRCDPYVNKLLTGQEFHFHCHSNLVRAVLPFGLTEFDVHDVLNVFQCTGLNDDDQYFMKACPAAAGDFIEFFAEIDLLCALSACPGGDLSVPLWGPDARDPIDVCRPLGVEIYALDPELLAAWAPPQPVAYHGLHGLHPDKVAWQEPPD